MAIVTLSEMKEQLGLTGDQDADDHLITGKIAAAQNHVERLLGFRIEAQFGGAGQAEIPPALRECVMQLATWWFDNREAVSDQGRELPFGVRDIITEYRGWTF
ncbi:MAG: head-tail connector protein [Paracoccus sp. (in: a-proteobacteria)]